MNKPLHFQSATKDLFYITLQQRVEAYFTHNKCRKTGNNWLYIKSFFFLTSYILAYGFILMVHSDTMGWGVNIAFCYALMGFLTVPLILNIGHEAVHNTFSTHSRLNKMLTWIFNLVGADAAIWHYRHIHAHHAFTNVVGYDHDIGQSHLARLAPDAVYFKVHRWQHFYMPFMYLIYTLNWLIYRDFKDYYQLFKISKPNWRGWTRLILSKIFYFSYILILPLYLFWDNRSLVIGSFLLMQAVMSVTTFLILVSTHLGEEAVFPMPNSENDFSHTWAAHQLLTTTDFAPNSWLVTQLFGGFNLHVVHHLFPHISHIHYPALTQLVRETAQEFGLTYNQFPSFGQTIVSHFKLLKNNSLVQNLFHATDI